jgi:hypothetical protein
MLLDTAAFETRLDDVTPAEYIEHLAAALDSLGDVDEIAAEERMLEVYADEKLDGGDDELKQSVADTVT